MKIVLIRHGKVDYPPLKIISATAFSNWVKEYDTTDLDRSSIPSNKVIEIVAATKAVVCSALMRSHDSANKLGVKNITYSDSLFNEAELPSANWKLPPLSVRVWAMLFRLFWFFGYSKNSESLSETRVRAKKAVEKLSELASTHGSVAFIGHGIFNRMLANRLLAAGWSGPKKPNSEYWGFVVYEK